MLNIEKILDKKFKKSIISGYDPYDVDHFFDLVIIYLKENEQKIEQISLINEQLKKENEQLKIKYNQSCSENLQLKTEIKTYVKEGYGQAHINNKIQSIQQKVNSLEKTKN